MRAMTLIIALLAASAAGSLPAPLRGHALDRVVRFRGGEEAVPGRAATLKAAADAAQRKGDWDGAAEAYEAALEAVGAEGGAGLLGTSTRLNLARVRLRQKRFADAERCCDDVLAAVGGASPLAAAALYRRACAREARGALPDAHGDARRAAALGHGAAAPIAARLAEHAAPEPPARAAPAFFGNNGDLLGGAAGGGLPPGAADALKARARALLDDPAKARAIAPLIKAVATPAALERALGLPPDRAAKIAAFLPTDEDAAERWARRAKRVLSTYRRVKAAAAFAARTGPRALYAFVLYHYARDSLALLAPVPPGV